MIFTRELLTELLRHMEWADARVWSVVPETTPADARLAQTLTHIHVVQRAFLTLWTGGELREWRKPEDFPSLADMRAWARTYYPEAHAFVAQASDELLSQPLKQPWADEIARHLGHPPGVTTIAETCFQVTSHSTYHRAQVNTRLREIGIEPVLVDYIAWLWMRRPAPEWKA